MRDERVQRAWRAALRAVEPGAGVERVLGSKLTPEEWLPGDDGELCVLGCGKAAVPMVRAAVQCAGRAGWGRAIHGAVVAPAMAAATGSPKGVQTFEGGHPLPSDGSLRAGTRIGELADGLGRRDRVLMLVSGGGSASMASPVVGIDGEALREATRRLLGAGLEIESINAVRKHLSRIKGGRLARRMAPAPWQTLALSDVVGDSADAIASGPTVADSTSFDDAVSVVRQLQERAPRAGAAMQSVRRWLTAGAAGRRAETPRRFAFERDRERFHLTGWLARALDAAASSLREERVQVVDRRASVAGEASLAGRSLADALLGCASDEMSSPRAVVWGGETTVDTTDVAGEVGLGGPCQEVALSAALHLSDRLEAEGDWSWSVAALSTDGIDGPTDAAGAVITEPFARHQRRRACLAGLARHDAYHVLQREEALVKTGPTGTNVNDLYLGILEPRSAAS